MESQATTSSSTTPTRNSSVPLSSSTTTTTPNPVTFIVAPEATQSQLNSINNVNNNNNNTNNNSGVKTDPRDIETLNHCVKLLSNTPFCSSCSHPSLSLICTNMALESYPKGTNLLEQGQPQEKLVLISSGAVHREHLSPETNQVHYLGYHKSGIFGAYHFLRSDPCHATMKADTDVKIFTLSSSSFKSLLTSFPQIAEEILHSLCREVRSQSKLLRTPLLEQKSKPIQIFSTTIAATLESFYRSALNSLLVRTLSSSSSTLSPISLHSLFPNMHIQIPIRVLYINGFKITRLWLERNITPENYFSPNLVRLLSAFAPGLIMSPLSSILEACNAGHLNSEPLYKRWIRGFIPRGTREVMFGVGLNQLSDYCEERVPNAITNEVLKNAIGSMFAGVISGYVSHVPHNLSTLKLLYPTKTYKEHFAALVQKNKGNAFVEKVFKREDWKKATEKIMTVVAPKGVLIRTLQIVGSFIILNGTINYIDMLQYSRKKKRELKT